MKSYDVCPTELRQNEVYLTFYYVYLYTAFMAIGPFVLLLILNTIIILGTRQSFKKIDSAAAHKNDVSVLVVVVESKASAAAAVAVTDSSSSPSDTITLILVVFIFILCNILVGVFVCLFEIYDFYSQPLTVNFLELFLNLVNTYLIDMSNLMVVLNSSSNFLIYYAFGAQFRRTLKQYLTQYIFR